MLTIETRTEYPKNDGPASDAFSVLRGALTAQQYLQTDDYGLVADRFGKTCCKTSRVKLMNDKRMNGTIHIQY